MKLLDTDDANGDNTFVHVHTEHTNSFARLEHNRSYDDIIQVKVISCSFTFSVCFQFIVINYYMYLYLDLLPCTHTCTYMCAVVEVN